MRRSSPSPGPSPRRRPETSRGRARFAKGPRLPADAPDARQDRRRRRPWRAPGAPASGDPPGLAAFARRRVPRPWRHARDRPLPRDGRVPVPVGCPGDAGTQRETAAVGGRVVAAVAPSAFSQAGSGRAASAPSWSRAESCRRHESEAGVARWGPGRAAPRRAGGGSRGGTGSPAPPCVCLVRSVRAVPESPDAVRADGGGAGNQTPKHRDAAERGWVRTDSASLRAPRAAWPVAPHPRPCPASSCTSGSWPPGVRSRLAPYLLPHSPAFPRLAVAPLPSRLSFWRGAGWRRQDRVPKFFPSAAETAEAIILFSGSFWVWGQEGEASRLGWEGPDIPINIFTATRQVSSWKLRPEELPGSHFTWMGIYLNQTHFIPVPLLVTLPLITFDFLTPKEFQSGWHIISRLALVKGQRFAWIISKTFKVGEVLAFRSSYGAVIPPPQSEIKHTLERGRESVWFASYQLT